MYIQYAFTNIQCGTTGNACAPPRYSTFRLQKPDKDYSEGINVSPTATYILLKLCNDDTTAGHLLELEADDGLSRLVAGPA